MSSSTRPPEGAVAALPAHHASKFVMVLRVGLVVLYPVLAHVAAVEGANWLAAVALGDILLVLLLDGLLARRAKQWLLLVLAVPTLVLLSRSTFVMAPLLLMPAILIAVAASGFARTLRSGRTPLIASIVEALEGGMTPPLTVTNTQWSWFANGFNYGILGLFFVAEFAYRRHCFPERVHGFRHFATRLARMGPAFWRKALR